MAEAYRIQDAGLSIWPDEIAGWKIGLVGQHLRQTLKAERLSGPIFGKDVRYAARGETLAFPVFVGGFAGSSALTRTARLECEPLILSKMIPSITPTSLHPAAITSPPFHYCFNM